MKKSILKVIFLSCVCSINSVNAAVMSLTITETSYATSGDTQDPLDYNASNWTKWQAVNKTVVNSALSTPSVPTRELTATVGSVHSRSGDTEFDYGLNVDIGEDNMGQQVLELRPPYQDTLIWACVIELTGFVLDENEKIIGFEQTYAGLFTRNDAPIIEFEEGTTPSETKIKMIYTGKSDVESGYLYARGRADQFDQFKFIIVTIPEPTGSALLLLGGLAMALRRSRKA